MAIAAGAVIAIGGAIQADKTAKAATSAADKQQQAASQGRAESARQFDITQTNLKPFQEAGAKAVQAQQDLTGLSGVDAQETAFRQFKESPGQQFIRQRAQRNLLQNAVAIGGVGGGTVRRNLVEQGAEFAAQDFNNQLNRLSGIRTGGQSAANSIGQFGANAANTNANLLNQGAQAGASGILGAAEARNRGIGSIARGFGTAFGGNQ